MWMAWMGILLAGIGGIIWLTGTDFSYDATALTPGFDETNPNTQSLGGGLFLAGVIVSALGFATMAICNQLVSIAVERRDLDRKP